MRDEAGHIEAGTPLLIFAVLGAIALVYSWSHLAGWLHVVAIVVLVVLAGLGAVMSTSGGMASNLSDEQLEELSRGDRDDAGDRDDV